MNIPPSYSSNTLVPPPHPFLISFTQKGYGQPDSVKSLESMYNMVLLF